MIGVLTIDLAIAVQCTAVQLLLQVREQSVLVETEAAAATAAAQVVATTQTAVNKQQAAIDKQMTAIEPAVLAAMTALDALDRKELGQCKVMSAPPTGVTDVLAAVLILLATGTGSTVPVDRISGRVKDKDRGWEGIKKHLLGNINSFLEQLHAFKVSFVWYFLCSEAVHVHASMRCSCHAVASCCLQMYARLHAYNCVPIDTLVLRLA
jgi:Microtubule-binding stalk of dynein motor